MSDSNSTKPFVSIIIPAFNAEETMEKCLQSLKEMNYPHDRREVIIVDDGSTDNTYEIAQKLADKVIKTENRGPSAARNTAVEQAKGDYLAFTDSDCYVHPEWLNELLKGFELGDNYISSGGNQFGPPDDKPFAKVVQAYLESVGFLGGYTKSSKELIEVKHNPSCNVIYKKEAFDLEKGFLSKLYPGEDVEFDCRLVKHGFQIAYNPEAIVWHYRPSTIKAFARMMYRYGKWGAGYIVKLHGFFRFLFLMPYIIFILLVGFGILTYYIPWTGYIVSFIGLHIFIFKFLYKSRSLKMTLYMLLCFMITLICWNLGYFSGLFASVDKK